MYYRTSGSVDYVYLFILLALMAISLLVQAALRKTFSAYNKTAASCGLTGAQAARRILDHNGCGAQITTNNGKDLSDYYNPSTNTLCLSQTSATKPTIAAIGVACHEAGHAIQYAKEYWPAKLRMKMIPVANISSRISYILILGGFILSLFASQLKVIALAGIILFGIAVLVQVVTLPVEFDASRRALSSLKETGILTETEYPGARKILQIAALTYVVAMLSSMVQLLRFVSIYNRR